MAKIKAHLSALLYYLGIAKKDLYYTTGYHYEEIKTKEDLKEVIRLLNNWYFIPSYLLDVDGIK